MSNIREKGIAARIRNEFIVIVLSRKHNYPPDEIGGVKSREYGFDFYHLLKYFKNKKSEMYLRDILRDDWEYIYSLFRGKYRTCPRKCRITLIEKLEESKFDCDKFLYDILKK